MATANHLPPQIVLSSDQVRAMQAAKGSSVELLDDKGKRVGYAASSGGQERLAEDIAIAKARLATPGPQYTIDEVLARVEALAPK